eukprot:2524899-Amphidinium_carterae.1
MFHLPHLAPSGLSHLSCKFFEASFWARTSVTLVKAHPSCKRKDRIAFGICLDAGFKTVTSVPSLQLGSEAAQSPRQDKPRKRSTPDLPPSAKAPENKKKQSISKKAK